MAAPPPQGCVPSQGYAGPGYPSGPPQGKSQIQWMQAPEAPAGCPPGLEYLTQVDQLLVNQQIELLEILTGWETQNKYRIRNSLGQQIYFAVEDSNCCLRQYCGPSRPFSMSIIDNNQKEVIHLERPLRCAAWCCFCCLQTMEVQSPPGTVIGYVEQDCTFIYPWFSLKNAEGETLLKIKGPFCTCRCCWDVEFQVLSADGTQEVGKITKKWSGLAKEYFTDADNFGVTFPMDLDVKMKAVVLAATFLIVSIRGSLMEQMKVLFLAPQPLCTPQGYDDTYQVPVQLDEPLWMVGVSHFLHANMITLCMKLDALILSQSLLEGITDTQRKVTFEHTLTSKTQNVIERMTEQLRRNNVHVTAEEYLQLSGLNNLFPRVLCYLKCPVSTDHSKLIDIYLNQVTALNNLLVIAQELQTDLQVSASHKYIAHQLAILYQCVGSLGTPLAPYKRHIEELFDTVKIACIPSEENLPPRLSSQLQKSLSELTQALIQASTSFQHDLVLPLSSLLTTLHII